MLRTLGKRAELALVLVSGGVLLFLMSLTVADVVMRYFLVKPIRGAYELTEVALAMLIFTGLPLASLYGAHVTADLIDRALGAARLVQLNRIVDAASGVILIGVALLMRTRAERIAEAGDVSSMLRIPLAPFIYAIAALLLLTAAMHLGRAWLGPPRERGAEVL